MLINATKKAKTMHARRNPNLTVSSAAYSQLSPSITSATFLSPTVASRRNLLSPSPPPSPNLPSLIPRHGKKPASSTHTKLVKRILVGGIGITILLWLVIRHIYGQAQQTASYDNDSNGEWEMVGGNRLPDEPSALVVQDSRGKPKWTVSIPSTHDFPLRPEQYSNICHQSMELSKQLREEAKATNNIAKRMLNYYQKDQYYIDIQEAEAQSILPPSKASSRPKGFVADESIAAGGSPAAEMKVCDRTLTYVMETNDAGFGSTLLRMWMSYGLAVKENRTFFVDDTRWPYGKYSTYFTPPPSAGCLPPPTSHMVPCPHTARHIVVSGATVKSTFGHAFTEEFEDATKMRIQRERKIFGLLRTGYEALFKLRADDAKYVDERAASLYGHVTKEGGVSIGMHVRHGDKHPYQFQYSKDYIPLDRYVDTARDIYIDLVENAGGKKSKRSALKDLEARHSAARIVLASDDPTVYDTQELGPGVVRAQDRIILATKAALEAAQGRKNPWIDEITGWEGGFYRDVFFSLGQPVGNAHDINKLDNTDKVPESAMNLRELVGRAYLMDLAMLGRADTVVCTVSSAGCRILAVMLGWDKSFEKGYWRNVDGSFDWKGIVW
ncbi:hypothetical protein BU24DRAFT_219721 [Aaosphaeria arxii CBS 175.79]|uniref:Glycosyltransferase family 23 protein n=1 Tax=Aaosphaeria arxii CBS 175.79 TaxID=1450172 RepID=A0A6A5XQX6_9PLEO|nr:uncharacterized protein BU24DRAFT_219721 [Aaosphaeria arxii CBS 175.79]KAF2014704.1 hypothetical protein BU24DRAFT_219721 [Aaosphaeria arxii CBS 175.79]